MDSKSRYEPLAMMMMLGLMAAHTVVRSETGQVVDRATGKPIPGAHVLATWSGDVVNPVQSSSRCYAYAATQADEAGRFSLPDSAPTPAPLLTNRERGVKAYAPGFENVQTVKTDRLNVEMQPFKESRRLRVKSLSNMAPLNCGNARNEKHLLPVLRAAYEEAKGLAQGERDAEQVRGMRAGILRMELGEEEFQRRLRSGDLLK